MLFSHRPIRHETFMPTSSVKATVGPSDLSETNNQAHPSRPNWIRPRDEQLSYPWNEMSGAL